MNIPGRPLLAAALLVATSVAAHAGSISIDFDTDATGQALTAPSNFDAATPLTNLYASLGVRFTGPGVSQGGAILNDSTFVTPAQSGRNFLALSTIESNEFSGPETVTFDTPMSRVSIHASGLGHPLTFSMQAFDTSNVLLDSDTILTAGFGELQVASPGTIYKVVLSIADAGPITYVFDDLSATSVPLPASMALLLVPLVGVLRAGAARDARQSRALTGRLE